MNKKQVPHNRLEIFERSYYIYIFLLPSMKQYQVKADLAKCLK